jgi:hypothetical protein
MRVGMFHSFLLFATRVVEIMFFSGLVGCATVVVISWISIFKDGFSDMTNREAHSHWEAQPPALTPPSSKSASASTV